MLQRRACVHQDGSCARVRGPAGAWRVLSGKMLFRRPTKVVDTIMACCILHNLCIAEGDVWGEVERVEEAEGEAEVDDMWDVAAQSGGAVREALATSLLQMQQ